LPFERAVNLASKLLEIVKEGTCVWRLETGQQKSKWKKEEETDARK
jgi:molybdopterin synthase catalytic subunit